MTLPLASAQLISVTFAKRTGRAFSFEFDLYKDPASLIWDKSMTDPGWCGITMVFEWCGSNFTLVSIPYPNHPEGKEPADRYNIELRDGGPKNMGFNVLFGGPGCKWKKLCRITAEPMWSSIIREVIDA